MSIRQATGFVFSGRAAAGAMLIAALLAILCGPAGQAAPQGENVVSGSATFERAGATTTITAGNRAIINYSSFDVAANETVRFVQPSATATVLNRIQSASPTRIDGSLQANGIVYLVNRAGVMFGPGSVVNVGGLYAAAATISNQDFLAGINRFTDTAGPVTNSGTIVADAVNLIGQTVANHGSIVATGGLVTMVAGKDVLLSEEVGGHLMVRLEGSAEQVTDKPGVENTGTIQAPGGKVLMGAGDMFSLAARQAGNIQADVVTVRVQAGVAEVSGTIDATGPTGGKVTVTGEKVSVKGATIDASGQFGGGVILIGGDYQGANPDVSNAQQTFVNAGSVLKADAIASGDGGKIIVWADQVTWFYGQASVRGGAAGGNGGFIETSGKGALYVGSGAVVDLSAQAGRHGQWLLDPTDVDLVAATLNMAGDPVWAPVGTPAAGTIDVAAIITALNGGAAVSVSTASGGAGTGTITVTSPITVDYPGDVAATTSSLTLTAGDSITVAGTGLITLGTTDDAGDTFTLNLTATNGVLIGAAINNTSGNGSIVLTTTGTTFDNTGGAITTTGGAVDIRNTGAVTIGAAINAGAGNVTIAGADSALGGSMATSIGGAATITSSGTILLESAGAIGLVGTPQALAATGTVRAQAGTDAYIGNTGAVSLGASTVGGTFSVASNTSLTVTGAISTVAANGPITISAGTGTLTVSGTIGSGSGAIVLIGDAMAIGSAVTTSTTLDVRPATATTTIGLRDATQTLDLDQTELTNLSGATLTIGVAGGSGSIIAGTDGAVTLAHNTVLHGGSFTTQTNATTATTHTVTINADAIDLQQNLTANGGITIVPVTPATTIGIGSAAGALNLAQAELARLISTGTVTIGSTAAGAVTVADNEAITPAWNAVIIGASYTQATNTASFGAKTLTITADAADIGTSLTANGGLTIQPVTDATAIGIGAVVGLDLSAAELGFIVSTGAVTIGSATGTGAVNVGGAEAVDVSGRAWSGLTIRGGAVTFNDNLTAKNNSTVTITAASVASPAATGLTIAGGTGTLVLTTTGAATLNTAIDQLGTTTTGGALSVTNDTSLTVTGVVDSSANPITLSANTGTLTVNATKTINAGASTVMLIGDSMAISAAVTGDGGVTVEPATGNRAIGIGAAPGGMDLSAVELALLNTTGTLTIGQVAGSGAVSIGASAMSAESWAAMTINGGTVTITGLLTLPAGATATFNTAGITESVAGSALTIAATGTVIFNTSAGVTMDVAIDEVGASTVGGALSLTNDTSLSVTGNVTTAAANGAITLSAATGTLTVTNTLDAGNGAVTLTGDSMAINNTVTGNGGITVQPSTVARAIGIGGTPGGMDLTAGELGNLTSTGTVIIGSATGTGAVDVGSDAAVDLSGRTWAGMTIRGGAVTLTNTLTLPDNATATITAASVVGAASPGLAIGGGAGTLVLTLTTTTVPSTLTTAVDVLGATSTADDLTITNDTSLNITGAVATTNDPVAISAGTGTLTVGNTIGAGTSTVTLTGDSMAINAVVTGNGGITVQPSTVGRAIGIGATTGEFDLTTVELGNLTSTLAVVIGALGGSGAVNIGGDGAVDLSGRAWTALTVNGGATTFNNVLTLKDNAVATFVTGQVTDSVAGAALVIGGTTGTVAFTASGAVAMDVSIDRLAASTVTGGALTISNDAALAVTGNLTATGVNLTAGSGGTGSLTFSGAWAVSADTISLRAGDGEGGTATATVNAVTGNPTFQNTAGNAGPTTFTIRQDAAIVDATLPAGARFTQGLPATYNLQSDDGAAVTINTSSKIAGSAVVITGSSAGDAVTINGAAVTQTGSITVNGGAGDDVFTLGLATGVFMPSDGVFLNGQTQAASDSLVITGGSPTTSTYTFTNANDGTIVLANSTPVTTASITYTGLEPITDSSTPANRVFTFTDAADVIVVSNADAANNNISQIASGASETVTFTNPTLSLTINTLGGGDSITVVPDTSGGVFSKQVTVTSTGNLTIGAAGIDVDAGVTIDSGGTLDINGPITTTTAAAGIVRIDAGGYVHQGAGDIVTADSLGVKAAGEIILTETNVIDTFAAESTLLNAAVQLTDTGTLSIGTVTDATPAIWGASLVGITTSTGNVTIITVGDLTVTNPIEAGGATVHLETSGVGNDILSGTGATDVTANLLELVTVGPNGNVGTNANKFIVEAPTVDQSGINGTSYIQLVNTDIVVIPGVGGLISGGFSVTGNNKITVNGNGFATVTMDDDSSLTTEDGVIEFINMGTGALVINDSQLQTNGGNINITCTTLDIVNGAGVTITSPQLSTAAGSVVIVSDTFTMGAGTIEGGRGNTAGGVSITTRAGMDMNLNGGTITAAGAGALSLNLGQDFILNGGSLTSTQAGHIQITAGRDVTLTAGTVNSSGTGQIQVVSGGIIADSDATPRLIGTDLLLDAVNGVGASAANPLNTQVDNLAVRNTTAGGIYLANTGALAIGGAGGALVIGARGVTDSSGATDGFIRAASPLAINAPALHAGSFTYQAGDSGAAGDDLTINADVTLTSAVNSTLAFVAGDDIIHTSGTVLTNGGGTHTVSLWADHEATGLGGITQAAGGIQTSVLVFSAADAVSLDQANHADVIAGIVAGAGEAITYNDTGSTIIGAGTIPDLGVVTGITGLDNVTITATAGTLDINGPITTTTGAAGIIRMDIGGYVHQNALGIVTGDSLGIRAAGEIVLTQNNVIDTFAARSTLLNAAVQFTDAANLSIGTVTDGAPALWGASMVGITSDGGNVTLLSTGSADIAGAVATVGGNFSLTATSITSAGAGTIATTAGVNTGTASGLVSLANSAAGDMTGLAGAIVTTGAANNAGAGSAGGAVRIQTVDGAITTPAITTTGGAATAGNNNGGAGGDVNILAADAGANEAHNVSIGAAIAAGGGAASGSGTAGAGGVVRVNADNNLTQAAIITAGSVGVRAGGSVTLGLANQISINTFAANATGPVTITNAGSLAVGTVADAAAPVFGATINGITTIGQDIDITSNTGSVIILRNLIADNGGGLAGDITITVPLTGALRNVTEQVALDPQYWHPNAVIIFGDGSAGNIIVCAVGSTPANGGTITLGGDLPAVPGIATIWGKIAAGNYTWFRARTFIMGQNSKFSSTGSTYVYADNATVGDMAAVGTLVAVDHTGGGASNITYLRRAAGDGVSNLVRSNPDNSFLGVFFDEGMEFVAGGWLNMPGAGVLGGTGGPDPVGTGSFGTFRGVPALLLIGAVANMNFDEGFGTPGVRLAPDGTELWILGAAQRGVPATSNLATALASALPGQQVQVSLGQTIDASQQEDLVRHLGIYTRGPTVEELLDYLSGRKFYNDAPESNYPVSAGDFFGAALSPSDNKVSIDRLPGELARQALVKYREVYWRQVDDPNSGKKIWKSVAGDLRRAIEKSVEEFKAQNNGKFEPVAYRKWAASTPDQKEANDLMVQLESLFHKIELLGLGPVEQSISLQMLARSVKPRGLSLQETISMILNVPVGAGEPAGEEPVTAAR